MDEPRVTHLSECVGKYWVCLHCRHCKASVTKADPAELLKRYGDILLSDFWFKSRCRNCRRNGATVRLSEMKA